MEWEKQIEKKMTEDKSLITIQQEIAECFKEMFGRTSLSARQKDILNEAIEVSRFTDIKNLRSEMGQLLCSVLTGINECGWNAEELINETLQLIKNRERQYKSLARKKKIAILGGAFNPITNGHIEVAQFVLNTSGEFDEIFLMPCFQHMYNKEMESPEHRLEMCKLASAIDGRIKVFSYEIDNKLSGETFNLINRLMNSEYANTHNFSMIIGQDNANTFDKWYNYKELEKLIRFVVVPRTGVPAEPKSRWYFNHPHIYLNPEKPIIEISSTDVRNYISWSKFHPLVSEQYTELLRNSINPAVHNYIVEHKLYGV